MRPSEFEAIRPHLERARGDINDYLKRRQALESDKELHDEFDRLEALPEGTPSKTKLKTIPRKQYKQILRSMLGPPPKQKGAMQQYRTCEKVLMRRPPITRPLIEHAYPWWHSAERAANDLRDCGWNKEAEAITEVLSGLPTGPVDGNQPEILARQLDAIRAGAERIRTILTTCLEGSAATTQAKQPAKPMGGKTNTNGVEKQSGMEADELEPIEKALALLVNHPEWSDAKIAGIVGVARTTLYKKSWSRYQQAREAINAGRNEMARGERDDNGNLEAWD